MNTATSHNSFTVVASYRFATGQEKVMAFFFHGLGSSKFIVKVRESYSRLLQVLIVSIVGDSLRRRPTQPPVKSGYYCLMFNKKMFSAKQIKANIKFHIKCTFHLFSLIMVSEKSGKLCFLHERRLWPSDKRQLCLQAFSSISGFSFYHTFFCCSP